MKKNWSKILNFILGFSTIGSFIFGIYAFYYNKSPSISLIKLSEINVLEINRSLDDLKIYYKDEDIQNENKNIKIIVLKIKNDGKVDITQDMYDVDLPWGILVNEGDIVQARIIDSSNDYLSKNLSPIINKNIIEFNKIIIESGESFSIELVLLCENKTILQYEVFGKIAGINNKNIKLIENNNDQGKSFWTDLIYGSIGIHFARAFLYFLCTIVLGVIIAFFWILISKIQDFIIHCERKKRVKLLVTEKEKGAHFNEIQNFYIYHGYDPLNEMLRLLNKQKELTSLYQKKISQANEINDRDLVIERGDFLYFKSFSLIDDMLKLKILRLNEDQLVIDNIFREEIKRFLKCIKQ